MQKKTKKIVFVLVWALVLPVFIASQVSFWQDLTKKVSAETLTAEEQAEAEKVAEERADAEKKAKKIQDDIDKAQKEKAVLQQNLGQIQQSVSITQGLINTTKSVIAETDDTLTRKEQEIKNLNNQVILKQELLKNLVQQAYYIQSQPILNVVLVDVDFSQIFSGAQHLNTLDEKILAVIGDINTKKIQIDGDKAELAKKKEEHLEVLDEKTGEKQELVAVQVGVQGDIQEKEATIGELQQKLVELQGDLNVLTGNSYEAKDIRQAVEYASGKTGVPKGVLYGFLKMETNLGANTGQCTYEQVIAVSLPRYKKLLKTNKKWQASIDLLSKRQNLFYDLVEDLGYGKKKKVSCSPSGYIGQGGAMGIPQFMSDVWNGYSSRIAAKTGHSTPDPWNLTDGVMAMAIKLQGAGATNDSAATIRKASINYLGTFYSNYYNGIVYWSKNYKRLFE